MKAAKTERLEARMTPEQKAMLELAAELSGLSLTDFVLSEATRGARRVMARERPLVLSPEDVALIRQRLAEPVPSRSAALQRAQSRTDVAVNVDYDAFYQSLTATASR